MATPLHQERLDSVVRELLGLEGQAAAQGFSGFHVSSSPWTVV